MNPRILSTARLFLPLATVLSCTLLSLLAFAPVNAIAANLFWSTNGTSQGGTGIWDTSNQRWGSSASGPFSTIWNNSTNAGDTARFGSTAGTVTLGTGITAGGLQFDITGYDRVANSTAITANGGGTLTYANTSGNNFADAETLGAITSSGGHLTVVQNTNKAGTTNNQTLTLSGLSRSSGREAVMFSAATTGPQASGGVDLIKVSGGDTTTGGLIIGPWAATGTGAAQTDCAVYSSDYVIPANITATDPNATPWSLATTPVALTDPSKGATTLTGNRSAAALRNTTTSASATFTASSATVSGHFRAYHP